MFQGMAIGGGAGIAAAQGIGGELIGSPGAGLETAALPRQTGIMRARAAAPAPETRRSGQQTDPEGRAAVPEAIDAPVKTRALEINPNGGIRIGIGVAAAGLQGEFQLLPDGMQRPARAGWNFRMVQDGGQGHALQ